MKLSDMFGNGTPTGFGDDYESPITIIAGQVETKFENDCMSMIQSYGIDINKDELIKALMYDRDQYRKGYEAGVRSVRTPAYWIAERTDYSHYDYTCSNCGASSHYYKSLYCHRCGARMTDVVQDE